MANVFDNTDKVWNTVPTVDPKTTAKDLFEKGYSKNQLTAAIDSSPVRLNETDKTDLFREFDALASSPINQAMVNVKKEVDDFVVSINAIKEKSLNTIEEVKADFIGKEMVNKVDAKEDDPRQIAAQEQESAEKFNPFSYKVDTKNTDFEAFMKDESVDMPYYDKLVAWQLNEAPELQEISNTAVEDYGLGEGVSDTAVSVGKGGVGVAESAYNIADTASKYNLGSVGVRIYNGVSELFSESEQDNPDYTEAFARGASQAPNKSLDELISGSEVFEVAKETLNSKRSDYAKSQAVAAKSQLSQAVAKRDESLKAKQVKGENSWWDILGSEAMKAGDAISIYASRPTELADIAIESGLQFILPAGVATAARNATLKTSKELTEEVAQRAASQGEKASMITIGLMEGANASQESEKRIMEMKVEDLEQKSDLFNKLVKQGLTDTEAQKAVAQNAGQSVFLTQSLMAGLVSRVMGTAKLEGELFKKKGVNLLNAPVKTAIAGLQEAGEEALQSATGTLLPNAAIKFLADDTQAISEELGVNVGISALAGGAMGASLSGARNTVDAIADPIKEKVAEIREVNAVANGEKTLGLNSESDNYNPEKAVDILMDRTVLSHERMNNPEARKEHRQRVTEHLRNVQKSVYERAEEIEELQAKGETTTELEKEQTEAVNKFQEYKTQYDRLKQWENKNNVASVESLINEAPDQLSKKQVTAINQVLGSSPESLSDSAIEKMVTNEALANSTREMAKSVQDYRTAVDETLTMTKNMGQVNNDIIQGGPGFLGIRDYVQRFSLALDSGDFSSAGKAYRDLMDFGKRHNEKLTDAKKIMAAARKKSPSLAKLQEAYTAKYSKNGQKAHIHIGSQKLVDIIESEVKAIRAAGNQFKATTKHLRASEMENTDVQTSREETVNEPTETTNSETTEQSSEAAPTEEDVATVEDISEDDPRYQFANKAVEAGFEQINALPNLSSMEKVSMRKTLSKVLARHVSDKNYRRQAKNLRKSVKKFTQGIQDYIDGSVKADDSLWYNMGAEVAQKAGVYRGIANELVAKDNRLTKLFSIRRGPKNNLVQSDPMLFNRLQQEAQNAPNGDADSFLQFYSKLEKPLKQSIKELYDNTKNTQLEKGPFYFFEMLQAGNSNGLVMAMTAAANTWVANTNGTLFNSNEDLNQLHGFEKDYRPSAEMHRALGRLTGLQNQQALRIGQDVLRTLGLQLNTETGSEMQYDKVAIEIGLVALNALEKSGVIHRVKVTTKAFNAIPEFKGKKRKAQTFISLKSKKNNEGKLEVNDTADSVLNAYKKNPQSLNSLLGIEDNVAFPKLEMPKKAPTKVKKIGSVIPKRIQEALLKHSQRPLVQKQFAGFFDLLSDEAQFVSSGGLIQSDIDKIPLYRHETSVQSINTNIQNNINNVMDFIHEHGHKPFYVEHEVWSNMRMGITNSIVNPQASKLTRHLVGYRDHYYEIDPTQNKQELFYFKLAVLQAMGVKSDRQDVKANEAEFEKLLKDENIQIAMDAIETIEMGGENLDPTTRKEAEAAINEIARKRTGKYGGENLASLDALYALTQYSDSEPFSSDLALEIDGVTNGVVLSVMQMGAFHRIGDIDELKDVLQGGGVFAIDSSGYPTHQNFGDYLSANKLNTDFYEKLGAKWVEFKNNITDAESIERYNALTTVLPSIEKALRKLSKGPTMQVVYGAGIDGTVANLVADLTEEAFTDIMGSSYEEAQIKLNELNKAFGFNEVLGTGETGKLNSWQPSQKLINRIQEEISIQYGSTLVQALESTFSGLMEQRNAINGMFSNGMDIIDANIKKEVAAYLKEKDINDTEGLSRKQYIEVFNRMKKAAPILQTYFSEEMNEGMVLPKFDIDESDTLRSAVNIAVDTLLMDYDPQQQKFVGGKQSTKRMNGNPTARKLTTPGVSGVVKLIHHMDAAIMLHALEKHTALNVHDAVYVSPFEAKAAAKTLNQATKEVSENYSITDVAMDWYKEAYSLVAKPTKDMKKAYARGISAQKDAQEARDKLFPQIGAYDQYSLPDGHYDVLSEENEGLSDYNELVSNFSDEVLGSSSGEFGEFNPDEQVNIEAGNVDILYQRVKQTDGNALSLAHSTRLDRVMDELISKVLNPINVSIQNIAASTIGRYHTDTKKVDLKFSNFVRGGKTRSEVMTHEFVHAVTQEGLDNNPRIRKLVENLYESAKEKMKVSDLYPANATQAEKDAAQADFDYVFYNIGQVNQETDVNTGFNRQTKGSGYLHEFMAFGLSNEAFAAALSKVTVNESQKSESVSLDTDKNFLPAWSDFIVGNLWNAFNQLLTYVNNRIYGIHNTKGDDALLTLALHLGSIQQQHSDRVARYYQHFNNLNTKTGQALQRFIMKPVVKGLRTASQMSQVSKITTSTANTIERAKNINYAGFSYAMRGYSHRIGLAENGLAQSLANELKGATKSSRRWNILLRISNLLIDQTRMKTGVEVEKVLNESWKSGPLSQKDKEVVYHAMLKTDLSALLVQNEELINLNNMNVDEILNSPRYQAQRKKNLRHIQKALTDSKYLSSEVTKLQNELKTKVPKAQYQYYMKMAQSLATEMVTGHPTEFHSMNNAKNIVELINHPKLRPEGDIAAAESIIDQMVTLKALQQTDEQVRKSAGELFKKEEQAGSIDDNGFLFSLQTHALYKRESLKHLFRNNKRQMLKGYVKEQVDPFVSVIAVNPRDVAKAKYVGYQVVDSSLQKSNKDYTGTDRVMMVHKNRSQATWLKTTVSYTGKQARGSAITDLAGMGIDVIDPFNEGLDQNQTTMDEIAKAVARNESPIAGEPVLKPIINDKGEITGHRYVMGESTKRQHLNRNDDYVQAMGRMFSSIHDKVNTQLINEKVIEAAHEDYEQNSRLNPQEYVFIGTESTDKKYIETWRMLPKEMRDYAQQVTGRKGFHVPKSEFDRIFGYRKFWLSDWAEQKMMKREYKNLMGFVGKQLTRLLARPGVRFTERLLYELTGYAKDAIVVKTGSVLVGNIISNMMILLAEGINPVKAVKWQIEGWTHADNYQKARNRVVDLQHELKSNSELSAAKRKNILSKIAELEESMRISPVRDLVEAGVYQTIIEDLDYEHDNYTYANRIEEFTKPLTDKIPPVFKDVGNLLFMTHDTRMYKVLRNSTQMSDFAGRYALHRHNQQNSKMSSQNSIDYIMDTFIDYDTPTHKSLQYTNDVGIFMFTKFFLRIQKVILRQARYKPLGVIGLLTMQQLLQLNIPDIYGTFGGDAENWFHRFNSPIGSMESAIGLHGLNVSFLP